MGKGKWKPKIVPATTNNLNKAIVNFLLSNGHSASRINTTGVYDEKRGCWRRSGGRKGFFDIVACLKPHGCYLTIDTKKGNDIPSKEQLAYQEEVEAAGGEAWFVKAYEDFKERYDEWEFSNMV